VPTPVGMADVCPSQLHKATEHGCGSQGGTCNVWEYSDSSQEREEGTSREYERTSPTQNKKQRKDKKRGSHFGARARAAHAVAWYYHIMNIEVES
jgi:hypothetical protein